MSITFTRTLALASAPSPVARNTLYSAQSLIITRAPQVGGPMKRCRRCGTDRPTTEFHRQQSRPDGLYSYCVFCAAEYKQARKLSRMREQEPPPLPVREP